MTAHRVRGYIGTGAVFLVWKAGPIANLARRAAKEVSKYFFFNTLPGRLAVIGAGAVINSACQLFGVNERKR